MNFFGHAVVARWTNREASHLLGSMLPDFESMVRVPVVAIHDPTVQRGVDFHHQTDEAFHRVPTFLKLCSKALEALTAAGVRRGTARAVAHIGCEMFLDGWLAEHSDHVEGYLAALRIDTHGQLEWEDRGRAFAELRARLSRWGAPRDYADPSFVMKRLDDALRRRPALSMQDDQAPHVRAFLPELRWMVEGDAPELLAELQNALGLKG